MNWTYNLTNVLSLLTTVITFEVICYKFVLIFKDFFYILNHMNNILLIEMFMHETENLAGIYVAAIIIYICQIWSIFQDISE